MLTRLFISCHHQCLVFNFAMFIHYKGENIFLKIKKK